MMKVHRDDDHPGVLTLTEIKAQIALGTLTKQGLWSIINEYRWSSYYLSEDVLKFLEEYLNTTIIGKSKFYIRDKDSKKS